MIAMIRFQRAKRLSQFNGVQTGKRFKSTGTRLVSPNCRDCQPIESVQNRFLKSTFARCSIEFPGYPKTLRKLNLLLTAGASSPP
ncbi:hypothetical protein L596_019004 [Steinernema carpocapsae]|uniref:Uncharacterized protein n=1 Tax=Steinernema carpocapsae TaxID=34508 RepID=A0A4U5N6D9_STECR|nr:hypothetical protein L596_019004 [Steinernema carpocapsae]